MNLYVNMQFLIRTTTIFNQVEHIQLNITILAQFYKKSCSLPEGRNQQTHDNQCEF